MEENVLDRISSFSRMTHGSLSISSRISSHPAEEAAGLHHHFAKIAAQYSRSREKARPDPVFSTECGWSFSCVAFETGKTMSSS